MAIRKPYDGDDVFSSPEEARRGNARVTGIPLDAFRESLAQPEVRELVAEARLLRVAPEAELPQSLH